MHSLLSRRAALVAVLALSVLGTACKESTADDEPEPEVATMRIQVGASTVNVAANGTVTGGPLLIPRGTSTATVSYLRANGSADPVVTPAVFRTQVTIPGSVGALTFANSAANALNGTFTAAATGTIGGQITVGLLHVEENHTDFGPFPVTVQVTP